MPLFSLPFRPFPNVSRMSSRQAAFFSFHFQPSIFSLWFLFILGFMTFMVMGSILLPLCLFF